MRLPATPGTLIDGARMYAAAADAVNDQLPNAFHVLNHLLGMSAELALKGYLSFCGESEDSLKRYGHRLSKLYARAVNHGMKDTGTLEFQMAALEHNFRRRNFAYPAPGIYGGTALPNVRATVNEIVREAFCQIKGDEALDEMSEEPGLLVRSAYRSDIDPSGWATR